MACPGFSAESSLYRSALRYYLSGADDHANGVTLQELSSQISGSQPAIIHFPHLLCQPCVLDPILGCAQECVLCPDPYPSPRCTPTRQRCPASACCPPGQDPCYVSGQNKFCCPPGQSCCNPETNSCCPPETVCCNPQTNFCCPQGQTCCCNPKNDSCCPSGQLCCDPQTNLCADVQTDPLNCGACGKACGQGQECVNGQCICPVVPDPFDCLPGGRTSSSNYFLANNCQPITGLRVSLTATADIISDSGFTVQLNADSQQGVDAFQQYLFQITGNSIRGYINNWQDINTAIVCGYVPVADQQGRPLSTPISNGIPKGYTLRITLQYAGSSVSGALFEVINGSQTLGSGQLSVSGADNTCGMPKCPASSNCCRGYQSSADLSPITAFQVNIVGPAGGSTTFTSGAGNVEYSVSSGTLTALSSVPSCVPSNQTCTLETSNALYGQLLACPEQSMTQTFSHT